MPLKNSSNFYKLMNFYRIDIYRGHDEKCPFWKAILLSLIASRTSWSLHPPLYLSEEINKPSSSSLQTQINEACSTINWVLPPRTRLHAGSSLKIACLLPGEMHQERGIEKDGNGDKGGKKLNFATWQLWATSSVLEILYILQLQIWPSTLQNITLESQILKKYRQMKLPNSASLLRLLLFRWVIFGLNTDPFI